MNKIETVGFTGPFSDINFGDYAMLINNIYDLSITNIVLFSYNKVFLKKIKNDYLDKFNVDISEVKLLAQASFPDFEKYTLIPAEIINMVENYSELINKIQKIDVLIVNGGGYFNGLWSMQHRIEKLVKIIVPILIANQLKKKIVFTGNSYGPFGFDAEFFGCLFNRLNDVTFGCRDKLYSPMWLKQIKGDGNNIVYLPDDLFLINNDLIDDNIDSDFKNRKYIVMETYLPLEFIKTHLEHFKNFSEMIFNKYGLSVVFLPFNLGHGGMDQANYLNTVLDNYDFLDINKYGYLPINDATKIIANAELVVSNRYHALVLSLFTKTPIISILKEVMQDKRYYYNKNLGMLDLVLNGIPFDERYYLRMDYIEALSFISYNLKIITEVQINNYNNLYASNKEKLSELRKNFFNKIIKS